MPKLIALTIFLGFICLRSHAASSQVKEFWFNGAEINRYKLNQNRYGAQHPGHAEFIFVTEPFLTDKHVKDEQGNGPSTSVLKLNALRTFNTGIYAYRTMTSTFQPIDLHQFPHALKSTTSVQDWCGQAFQQFNRRADHWDFELRSYFQGEADQNKQIQDAYLEDAFWLMIRLQPSTLPTGNVQVIPGSLYHRFAHKPVAAHTAQARLDRHKTTSTYHLNYPNLQRQLSIQFENKFPHIIQSWTETTPQGTTEAHLEDRIMNSYYWEENTPADRHKRLKLGLDPIAN